jgi:hypothetical protein
MWSGLITSLARICRQQAVRVDVPAASAAEAAGICNQARKHYLLISHEVDLSLEAPLNFLLSCQPLKGVPAHHCQSNQTLNMVPVSLESVTVTATYRLLGASVGV